MPDTKIDQDLATKAAALVQSVREWKEDRDEVYTQADAGIDIGDGYAHSDDDAVDLLPQLAEVLAQILGDDL